MIRSLKILGLALVAVLALSALVASAASAAPKLTSAGVSGTEEYPVTIKGSQTVENVFELEGTRPSKCKVSTFEGTIASKKEAEESKLTAKPNYADAQRRFSATWTRRQSQ